MFLGGPANPPKSAPPQQFVEHRPAPRSLLDMKLLAFDLALASASDSDPAEAIFANAARILDWLAEPVQ